MQTSQNPERRRKAELFRAGADDAWALFERAPCVRFAAADGERPVLRTLSAVVLDGRLCFHGADDGEKLGLLGRCAIASVDEVVAQVPSYFIHPELACPASTYYLSAFAEGRIARVDDLARKARILGRLMERFQPEGGYAPITPEDKRYTKVLEQLMVAELVPERVSAKHKLGQHRTRAQVERVLEGLWRRGAPGDTRAIRLIQASHPEAPAPAFLCGPDDSVFCVEPDADDAAQVASMLEGQYWTEGLTHAVMARAQLGSDAWIVARDTSGDVIASGRVIGDGARLAWLLDVIVRPDWRGRGVARALVERLLDHPRVRGVADIRLRTRDAHGLYEQLGFERVAVDGVMRRASQQPP